MPDCLGIPGNLALFLQYISPDEWIDQAESQALAHR